MSSNDYTITCAWCKTSHAYQFVSCKNCRKPRLDIWEDQQKGETYFLTGAVMFIIAIIVFIAEIPPSSSPRFFEMLTTLLILVSCCIVASCCFMYMGSRYFSRARKKIHYHEYSVNDVNIAK